MKKNRIADPCSMILTLLDSCTGRLALFAQSTTTLRPYDSLKGKEREQKLIEGAKKEGKVVVYSFTAVDQLSLCSMSFKRNIRLSLRNTTAPMLPASSTSSRLNRVPGRRLPTSSIFPPARRTRCGRWD